MSTISGFAIVLFQVINHSSLLVITERQNCHLLHDKWFNIHEQISALGLNTLICEAIGSNGVRMALNSSFQKHATVGEMFQFPAQMTHVILLIGV